MAKQTVHKPKILIHFVRAADDGVFDALVLAEPDVAGEVYGLTERGFVENGRYSVSKVDTRPWIRDKRGKEIGLPEGVFEDAQWIYGPHLREVESAEQTD